MKVFRSLINFYINSSIHVALAGVAFTMLTLYQFKFLISINTLAFVFFGIITSYNFVKYAEFAGLHHRRLASSLKAIQLFSVACFLLLIYFTSKQSFETLAVTGFFGIFTVLYAVPFLSKKNLRTFSSIKIFVVAFVWAGITVLVPVISNQIEVELDIWLLFVQRFLIVVVLMFPFDIRDLKYDEENLKTLPQILGIRNCKILGTLLLLIVVILQYIISFRNLSLDFSLCMFCIMVAILLWGSNKKNGNYYASFWVEAAAIIWIFLYYIIEFIIKSEVSFY